MKREFRRYGTVRSPNTVRDGRQDGHSASAVKRELPECGAHSGSSEEGTGTAVVPRTESSCTLCATTWAISAAIGTVLQNCQGCDRCSVTPRHRSASSWHAESGAGRYSCTSIAFGSIRSGLAPLTSTVYGRHRETAASATSERRRISISGALTAGEAGSQESGDGDRVSLTAKLQERVGRRRVRSGRAEERRGTGHADRSL
jgi:hypothetical protein